MPEANNNTNSLTHTTWNCKYHIVLPIVISITRGSTSTLPVFERHGEQRYFAKPDSAEKFSDPARQIYRLRRRTNFEADGCAHQKSKNYITTI